MKVKLEKLPVESWANLEYGVGVIDPTTADILYERYSDGCDKIIKPRDKKNRKRKKDLKREVKQAVIISRRGAGYDFAREYFGDMSRCLFPFDIKLKKVF